MWGCIYIIQKGQVNTSVHRWPVWSGEEECCLWLYHFCKQTSLVPESQICQRCAGTSCRFPAALVSRRSYSQSTQTHHSRHPLHSPGSAGSQLERKNRLGEGPYRLFTAKTAAHCYSFTPLHIAAQNHKADVAYDYYHRHRRSLVCSWPRVRERKGMQGGWREGREV